MKSHCEKGEIITMNEIIKINDHKIVVKEYMGRRVVTFKDIDTVHERPYGTARKRFNDNKKHFIESEDFYIITQASEIRTLGIERPQGGVPDKVILITESGYLMLVKSLTDDLAWDVQRKLVNSYFGKKKSMSIAEQIQILAQGNIELNNRVDSIEKKLEDFKRDMPLLGVETEKITNAIKRKGVEVLGGKRSNAYKDHSLRAKLYQDLHKDLRRQFGVSTYRAIKRNQCDKAVVIIQQYNPPMYLKEQIDGTNAQLNIAEISYEG